MNLIHQGLAMQAASIGKVSPNYAASCSAHEDDLAEYGERLEKAQDALYAEYIKDKGTFSEACSEVSAANAEELMKFMGNASEFGHAFLPLVKKYIRDCADKHAEVD